MLNDYVTHCVCRKTLAGRMPPPQCSGSVLWAHTDVRVGQGCWGPAEKMYLMNRPEQQAGEAPSYPRPELFPIVLCAPHISGAGGWGSHVPLCLPISGVGRSGFPNVGRSGSPNVLCGLHISGVGGRGSRLLGGQGSLMFSMACTSQELGGQGSLMLGGQGSLMFSWPIHLRSWEVRVP